MLKRFFEYMLMIIFAFLSALNYSVFIFPNKFAPAGIDGICTMIQDVSNISMGYLSLVVNIPLVIAAFPFVARLVESSLREINPNIIEAAESMGATPFQIIVKVMIPESVPSLISNFTIAITTVLGYSAMSGIIGGGGLGKIAINYGYYRYRDAEMYISVVLLVLLVIAFQSLGNYLAKKSDKRLKNK